MRSPNTSIDSWANSRNVTCHLLRELNKTATCTGEGGSERIGRAWDFLMKRLGYTRYIAQAGDWEAGEPPGGEKSMRRNNGEAMHEGHTNLSI